MAVEVRQVGIERKERVSVVELAKEFAASHFFHSGFVEFQVVPWRRVANHVPADRIDAVFFDSLKGVDGVAEAFAHLIAVFIEH